jgi:hypothetical protein
VAGQVVDGHDPVAHRHRLPGEVGVHSGPERHHLADELVPQPRVAQRHRLVVELVHV